MSLSAEHIRIIEGVNCLIDALEKGNDKAADSCMWSLERVFQLVEFGETSTPTSAARIEELLAIAVARTNESDPTFGVFDDLIARTLQSPSEVGQLLRHRVASNDRWHNLAHRLLSNSSLAPLCETFKRDHSVVAFGPVNDPSGILSSIPLVRIGQSIVPSNLAQFRFESDSDGVYPRSEWFDDMQALRSLLPLTHETARTIASFELARNVLNPAPCEEDPFFWAWEFIHEISMGTVTSSTAADCVTLLRVALDVFADYPEQIGFFAAGFIEDSLRSRTDTWEPFASLARSDPRFRDALAGVWVDADTAQQMPAILSESVIILGEVSTPVGTKANKPKKVSKGNRQHRKVRRK